MIRSIKALRLLFFLLPTSTVMAQTTTALSPSPAGTYYLEGAHEVASGFLLRPDSSFAFFFSYGALDRYGSGSWTRGDLGSIILNSPASPGRDYRLVRQFRTKEAANLIQLEASDPVFYTYTYCRVVSGNRVTEQPFDSHGWLRLPSGPIDSIELKFAFAEEKTAVFAIKGDPANNFVFGIEPWLLEVFFRHFTLQFKGDRLEGAHPLLKEKTWVFRKEE
ncbi:MAG TPA: hypothetical protein VHK69_14770 [Chitinophagaceae bacterium]|jgi:hypothetical protein|nr:hypothetical protein [Chitinophagaceae bacterium]